MKFRDRDEDTPPAPRSRVDELTSALEIAERKLAERELLIAAAVNQTEIARAQYEQVNARVEALRRQLATKEEQVGALQEDLRQRIERIALLEKILADSSVVHNDHVANDTDKVPNDDVPNDDVLSAVNDDAKSAAPASPIEQLAALGLAMESLDQPGTLYRISRAITTIGRVAANDIAINSHLVSRFHARIVVEEAGVFLVDLLSTNGSKVNGQPITRQMIGDADTISIGDAKFRFSVGAPPAEIDARGMQATHVLLNDSVILVPAPNVKPRSAS